MASRTNSQKQRELTKPKLRVSQIVVQLVLLNEHDSPVTPEPIMFVGTEDGSAAENLTAWLESLPVHLELASAHISAPETNGAA